MPVASAKRDVTAGTESPSHLLFRAENLLQTGGPNLEGTLKVTGAKTMFLLARGRLGGIRSRASSDSRSKPLGAAAEKTPSKGQCGW